MGLGKWGALGLLAGVMVAEAPKQVPLKQATVCSPPGAKQPSLMLPDQKGNCAKGTEGMKSKDGKLLYCVNRTESRRWECKQVQVPGAAPSGGVKKK